MILFGGCNEPVNVDNKPVRVNNGPTIGGYNDPGRPQ